MTGSVVDDRAAADVGRKARLELVFSLRRGRTVLAHGYAEPPFRLGAVFPDADGARMILAWSAPGIFGGDRLEQHVRVERGASVSLASQSALQAHPSPSGAIARMRTTVEVEEGAALRCEWDPLIPFPAARVSQQYAVQVAPAAALYWSDAFMSGREGRGTFPREGLESAPFVAEPRARQEDANRARAHVPFRATSSCMSLVRVRQRSHASRWYRGSKRR